jgi:hypothetical protein
MPPPRWVRGRSTTASAPASSAPTTSATYSPPLCSAAADYQKAANAIVISTRARWGPTASRRALQNLQTAAQNLTTAAKEQFGPQVAELDVSSQAPG